VIQDARAGLTSRAGDGAALAANVESLAAMPPDDRRAMGARGADFARREFSLSGLIDRLEGWLSELAERAPRPETR
jgi:colanic acid biosynthesis glycosyl transferase WcaI